jgi:hypothetical protein
MTGNAVRDRAATLAHGDTTWDGLRIALDARMSEPVGPATDWTGHDIYAHFARWQEQSIKDLGTVLSGKIPQSPKEDEDTLNQRWRSVDRDLPDRVVVRRCLESRATLRAMLVGLDDGQWQQFGQLFSADIDGGHYEHHLAMCAKELLP